MSRGWLCGVVLLGLLGCAEKGPEVPADGRVVDARVVDAAVDAAVVVVKPAAPQSVPAVAGVLSGEHTIAAVGLEGLDRIASEVRAVLDAMPLGSIEPGLTAELAWGEVVARLGFDPRGAEGWAGVGVDPAGGVAVVVDGRLWSAAGVAWPVVLARVTDRGRLVGALARVGVEVTVSLPETDGVARATWKGGRALVGERGGWTAVLVLDGAEVWAEAVEGGGASGAASAGSPAGAGSGGAGSGGARGDLKALEVARPAFAAWLAGEAGLVESKAGAALRFPVGARAWMAGFSAALVARLPDLGAEAGLAAFYAERFGAVAASVGADLRSGSLRVLADAEAVAALRQVFVPERVSPGLARFVDPAAAVVGFSVDPGRVFDGVVALLPAKRGDLRGKVVIAQNAVPILLGVSQVDLAAAFTGHGAVVMPAGFAAGHPPTMVVLGVGDGAVAERVVPVLIDKLVAQEPGAKREATLLGGRPGFVLTAHPAPAFFVLVDGVLLVSPERAAVEAAVERAAGAVAGTAGLIDSGAFWSMAMPLSAMEVVFESVPADQRALMAAGSKLWGERVGDPITVALRVDDEGIVSEGPVAALLVGAVAGVGAAAFERYLARSKEAQARMALRQLYEGGLRRSVEGTLPASVALWPAADPCAGGGVGGYEATAATWDHPTWIGLGFAPVGLQSYRYGFEKTDDGFIVRAVGDLDCDGVVSTYEMRAQRGEDGGFVGTPSEVNALE